MAVNLKNILTSLENLIEKNNTTTSTYDVSSGLNKRVQSVYKGVRGVSGNRQVPMTVLPAVFVELDSKTEEYPLIGKNAKRDHTIQMGIVPIVNYGAGISEGLENSDMELITLTQNIESLIRNFPDLSSTVELLDIDNTDYSNVIKAPDIYVSVSRINVVARLKSRE